MLTYESSSERRSARFPPSRIIMKSFEARTSADEPRKA